MITDLKIQNTLEQLILDSENYYKWVNKFDLRIEDYKLRSSIAAAREVLLNMKNADSSK